LKEIHMVSSTKQTEKRRSMRHSKAGRHDKRKRVRQGTPAFPIHPEGYDPKAPDARRSDESAD
jgi:hypothetical protein